MLCQELGHVLVMLFSVLTHGVPPVSGSTLGPCGLPLGVRVGVGSTVGHGGTVAVGLTSATPVAMALATGVGVGLTAVADAIALGPGVGVGLSPSADGTVSAAVAPNVAKTIMVARIVFMVLLSFIRGMPQSAAVGTSGEPAPWTVCSPSRLST